MPTLDDQFACPNCATVLRNRDLLTTVTEQCRVCKAVIQTTDRWGFRNAEAILQEDVFSIDTWLSQVSDLHVTRIPDSEDMGKFVWSIAGPSPCRCEVLYEKFRPGVARIRLCVDVADADALPEKEAWHSACHSNCVQPCGVTGTRTWWGAEQAVLLITDLSPALFRRVVDRLSKTIHDVRPSHAN